MLTIIEKEVLKSFRNQSIESPIIIACSGGVDSMVLSQIFLRLQHKLPQLYLAHVNYHLRGQDSDADQQLVEKFAAKNEVELFIHSIDLDPDSSDLQNQARKIRYDFFAGLSRKLDRAVIALAQHADDQVETILMRLIQGASLQGLSGISEFSEREFVEGSVKIWRPLLNFSKRDLIDYAEAQSLIWREDRSNQYSKKYLRNKIRLELLPMLQEMNPQIHEQLLALTDLHQSTAQLIQGRVESLIEQYKRNLSDFHFIIPRSIFLDLEKVESYALLQKCFSEILSHSPLETKKLVQIERAISEAKEPKLFEFKKGFFIEVTHRQLSFYAGQKGQKSS